MLWFSRTELWLSNSFRKKSMLHQRGHVRRGVGQQGQLDGHISKEHGLGEAMDPNHEVFLGSVEFPPPLDHFKDPLVQVINMLEQLNDDRHEDRNVFVEFMNVLQTHQWRMMDTLDTLVRRKKILIEKLD